jgi:hypothetical protein
MGGVVGRYYVSLRGGAEAVAHLVTIGSPLVGTDVSRAGVGHPTRELVVGSKLLARIAHAPPTRTKLVAIWSRADALVPGTFHHASGAEHVVLDDLGHVAMLASPRVAREIVARLSTRSQV